ncbi:D-2-hydroxyacid dehydrogenase [Pseudoalteromonas piratica]|uniref:Glycerate dehydrogenase n=1 Tax=Pseudoalteromonas piratica TaxID=1348114 RepID=A0A0A7EDV5_9GAMM|nr:D-2-hydroxyacid dehydrogenase [Pseudoalteromonas piratica]AIY64794.1 glycerate dehydrogenase [Pseudoalteromonas piratica]
MKIVILDYATIENGDLLPLNEISSHITTFDNTHQSQVVERCDGFDVVITNKVVINQDALSKLNTVKLICIAATGTNNVDLVAAKQQDIAVTNVAGYSTASVVQHTFALLFNLLGNTHKYIADCKNGQWQQAQHFCFLGHPINEVAGLKMALIGYGDLGSAVAKAASAFGIEVLISERKNSPVREGRVAFEEALKHGDIISIHCPLNDDTKNLISTNEFTLMKPNAVLINTARGGIVNESALANALIHKKIAGAAIDVLSKEPAEASNPLIQYKGNNLLLTPHIAWASRQSISRLIQQIALNIEAFQVGQIRNRV